MDFVFEQRANTITCGLSNNLNCMAHLHEHIEAVYMISGYSELILEDGRFPLNPGDFSFVFPNQIHGYENSDNVRAFLLIFQRYFCKEASWLAGSTKRKQRVCYSYKAFTFSMRSVSRGIQRNSSRYNSRPYRNTV